MLSRLSTNDPHLSLAAVRVIIYHLLQRNVAYTDLGTTFFDEQDRDALQHRLVRRPRTPGVSG
jgi:hypothetical protein